MSKLGVSSQSGIIQDASKVLAKHPIAWKLFGNAFSLDFARKIRAESPSTLIILRAQPDNWALDAAFTNSYIDRATRAAEPFQSIVPQDKLLLEPPNEPIIQNIDNAKLLNELQVTVAHAYYARGFTPLGYQFPVGNPDYSLWQYLEDGLLACDGWIGLHEYGAPTLQSHAEDLSLRHRKVYANYLSPAAKAKLKVVITECALDFGILTTRTLPDGFPTAGGYRAMPQVNDDEDYWIKSLTSQLNWWDAALAQDPYVIATTIFGYAMEHPWETFDVSAIDTDRIYWIDQYQGGIAVIPPYVPPVSTSPSPSPSAQPEPDVITPAQTIATLPFLVKRAIQLDLGPSIYGEYDAYGDDGTYHAWIWQRGGVIVKDGDYGSLENAHLFNPQTGEPMSEPLPWPDGGETPTPPNPIKRLTTADLPPEYGIVVNSYSPKPGEKFFGLVGAGNFKSGSGVGTQTLLMAVNEQGSPVIGYFLTHAWDTEFLKSETFPSPTVGIILSTGSYYTPPALGPDRFYVSKGPSPSGAWPTPFPSDVVIGGMPGGQHFEAQFTWQLMTG